MSKIIVSTVGTSLINKNIKDIKCITETNRINLEKLLTDGEFKGNIKNELKDILQTNNNNVCAEISSINKIGIEKDSTKLYFLLSDTEQGEVCGEVLKEYYEKEFKVNAESIRIKKLQVNNDDFDKGIKNLVDKIINIVEKHKYEDVILNSTAGFKGIVPYITLIGMFFNKKINYIFEFTNTLLTLPPIPIEVNYDLIEKRKKYFEKINDQQVIKSEEFFDGLSYEERDQYMPYIIEEHSSVTFSALGELFYKKYLQKTRKSSIYISKQAKKEFDSLDLSEKDLFINIFNKLLNDEQRSKNLHSKMGIATDLLVFKQPHTSERVFYDVSSDDNIPRVYELCHHNDYERKLKEQTLKKERYNNDDFQKFIL